MKIQQDFLCPLICKKLYLKAHNLSNDPSPLSGTKNLSKSDFVNSYYKCTFYYAEWSLKGGISIDFNSGPLDAVIIFAIKYE